MLMNKKQFINLLFYLINIILVSLGMLYIHSLISNKITTNVILILYLIAYYFHFEFRQEILDKYYIHINDLKDPLDSMVQNFAKQSGDLDYEYFSNIDINNYSDSQIKKALSIYENIKYKI